MNIFIAAEGKLSRNSFAMENCKACGAPLTVLIQHDDEEHDGYLPDASSSAIKQDLLVDDDVELLQCGCHFHWCVSPPPPIASLFSQHN